MMNRARLKPQRTDLKDQATAERLQIPEAESRNGARMRLPADRQKPGARAPQQPHVECDPRQLRAQ